MADYDIKKIQRIELEILKEFDRVCKLHGLTYFLDSGTALGAVRHKGFIPWDDDIDVGMMRKDYEKFIRYAYKDLKPSFFLQTKASDPNFPGLFAKIRKNGTVYLENNKRNLKMHNGIWIDIFPYDYISGDYKNQVDITKKMERLLILYSIKKIPSKLMNTDQNPLKYAASAAVRKILHFCIQIVPDAIIINRINCIINENENEKDHITCYYYINQNGTDNPIAYQTDRIIPVSSSSFEGSSFPVPGDADYYLHVQYNNYMELPPEDKRVGHRPLFVDYGDR